VYDGRFTFTRLRWDTGRNSAWNHDFPRAEQNLTTLLREWTLLDADTTGSLILDLDNPQLFRSFGIHKDNDPQKRLMVFANHDNDIAESTA
jgi:hypothetical protein